MITSKQIIEKAKLFNLKQCQLVILANVNTSGVSRIFSKNKPKEPTPTQAAAFYWLFKYLETLESDADRQKILSLLGCGKQ